MSKADGLKAEVEVFPAGDERLWLLLTTGTKRCRYGGQLTCEEALDLASRLVDAVYAVEVEEAA